MYCRNRKLLTMKQLLTALLVMVCLQGCKSEKKKPTRYFFISYDIRAKLNSAYGNWYLISDTLPCYDSLEAIASRAHLCKVDGATTASLIITSIHEFKDSVEYYKFKGGRSEPLQNCIQDEPYSLPVIYPVDTAIIYRIKTQ